MKTWIRRYGPARSGGSRKTCYAVSPGWGWCWRGRCWWTLPELGRLSRQQLATLVGVAPLNRDQWHLAGPPAHVGRAALYMAALAAIRWNPPPLRGGQSEESGADGLYAQAVDAAECTAPRSAPPGSPQQSLPLDSQHSCFPARERAGCRAKAALHLAPAVVRLWPGRGLGTTRPHAEKIHPYQRIRVAAGRQQSWIIVADLRGEGALRPSGAMQAD